MAEGGPERRLRHFGTALGALAEAMALMAQRGLSELERAGAVQFFELSWDLGWKVLRDDLVLRGVTLEIVAPNSVVRAAVEAGIVEDADGWVAAGRTRNLLTHSYDSAHVDRALAEVRERFLPLLQAYLQSRRGS